MVEENFNVCSPDILLEAFASAFPPQRSQPCKNNEDGSVNDLFDSSLTLWFFDQ